MYILSGLYKGRKLYYSSNIRPSLSRVRKMVFDTLMPLILKQDNFKILDAFAGTGAYGFEALSMFGGNCTFLDVDKDIIKNLKSTINYINIQDKCQTILGNSLITISSLNNQMFNLIFIDPPYDKTFLIRKFLNKLIINNNINENTLIIVENSIYNRWDFIGENFKIIKDKKAASTRFVILKYQPIIDINNNN
jgi:16S rRNA (guanine966-N2)-methyltransferase